MDKKIEPYKGIAEIYEEVRPSYPGKLIQDVIEKTKLKEGDELLEIGAGTGKATIQFAEKGFKIQAIELGEDMAEIFKRKCSNYSNISLDIASFEKWEAPINKKYDGIYCAQAFHWLDTNIKYKKCHELLKDDGYLALFWYTSFQEESIETQEIDKEVNKIIGEYDSSYSLVQEKPQRRTHVGNDEEDEREKEIKDSGMFSIVEKIEYRNEVKNSARQYVKIMKSVPAFASILDKLDNDAVERMDNEIVEVINKRGGYVGAMFKFTLYIAKKIK